MKVKYLLIFLSIVLFCNVFIGCNKKTTEPEPEPEQHGEWYFPPDTNKVGIYLYSQDSTLEVDNSLDVLVVFYNLQNVFGTSIELSYPPDSLDISGIESGPFFSAPDDNDLLILPLDTLGRISYGVTYITGRGPSNGSDVVFKFKCKAIQKGNVTIEINREKLEIRKPDGRLIPQDDYSIKDKRFNIY